MLLLKNLRLVENQSLVDILVDQEKIIEIGNQLSCDNYIDFEGAYVSRGWIDLHVHCFKDETDLGLEVDRIGVDSGVCCICDAGSSGELTVGDFYRQVKDKKTIVKAFLNLASSGLRDRHELKDLSNIQVEKTVQKFKQYPDFIIGLKVRASGSVMGEDTKTPFKLAKQVKTLTHKPMMVHFGNNPPTIEEVLTEMDENDILTHCFHGKPNGILVDGHIKPQVLEKREEGVCFDVGHGQDSFSYAVSHLAKKNGFKPDSISTDLHKYNLDTPVSSLANVVNKFLNLGYSLNEVISWVTTNPAKMIGWDSFGEIKSGNCANLTMFKVVEEKKTLVDSNKNEINVNQVVKMVGCVVNGKFEWAKYEN